MSANRRMHLYFYSDTKLISKDRFPGHLMYSPTTSLLGRLYCACNVLTFHRLVPIESYQNAFWGFVDFHHDNNLCCAYRWGQPLFLYCVLPDNFFVGQNNDVISLEFSSANYIRSTNYKGWMRSVFLVISRYVIVPLCQLATCYQRVVGSCMVSESIRFPVTNT